MKRSSLARQLIDRWRFGQAEKLNSLTDLFQRSEGKQAAKWSGYLQHYDRVLGSLQDQPIRLLEIGVQAGGSLEIWAKYFQSSPLIIGCDSDPNCKDLIYDDDRIKVLIGDINDTDTLLSIDALTSTLDLVVDDGSHQSRDIIASFIELFPRLSHGGLYLIEDLHCSYWKSYGGGLYKPNSALAFFKKMVDVINQSVWGVHISTEDFFNEFKNSVHSERCQAWEFLNEIHSIEFVNSLCIIRKSKPEQNALGKLELSGNVDSKITSKFEYSHTEITVPDQSTNYFSQLSIEGLDNRALNAALLDEIDNLEKAVLQSKHESNQLKTQVYEATKKFYEASVTIQQLELKIKQLEQSNQDAV